MHVAPRVLPEPASATAPQPAIVVPSAAKLTLPVGALPLTEALNVTLVPTVAGLSELDSVVEVGANEPPLTTCDNGLLVDDAFAASPT